MKQIKIFYYTNFNGEFVDFYCTDGTTVQITLQDLLKEINRFTELEGDGYNDAMTKFKKDLNNCWRHILREDEIYKMTVKDLHKKAMHYNDLAILSKRDNPSLVNEYFLKAFEFEKQAYILFSSQSIEEPTRSILLRSAANLAYHAGRLPEAEKFVATALAGNPPADIAEELRDLFQQINFHRHLELSGCQLDNNELQLSLSGNDVGHGIIRKSEFTSRISPKSRAKNINYFRH